MKQLIFLLLGIFLAVSTVAIARWSMREKPPKTDWAKLIVWCKIGDEVISGSDFARLCEKQQRRRNTRRTMKQLLRHLVALAIMLALGAVVFPLIAWKDDTPVTAPEAQPS